MLSTTIQLKRWAESESIRHAGGDSVFAYRRHMNQQDAGHFNQVDTNIQIQNLSGVFVPGRGVVIVPGTTTPATQRRHANRL